MPRFEVHIPSSTPTGFNVTFRLEAEHWMGALKLGMAKLGEQGSPGSNMLVDLLPDESIDVTDSQTGRVFRIRELDEAAQAAPSPAAPGVAGPAKVATAAPEPATIRIPAVSPGAVEPSPIALTQEVSSPRRERGGDSPTERELPAIAAPAPSAPVSTQPVEPAPSPILLTQPAVSAESLPAAAQLAAPGAVAAEAPVRAPAELAPVEPAPEAVAPGPIAAEPATPKRVPVSPGPIVRDARDAAPEPAKVMVAASLSDAEATPRRRAIRMPAIKDETLANAKTMPERPVRAIDPVRPVEPVRIEPIDRPSRPITGLIGRAGPATRQVEVLSELFERTQEVFGMGEPSRAMGFLLDLALEKIPCDAGSIFLADLGSPELELAAARGPKGPQLEQMKLRVPVGIGIVGFCAQEAVSLAISETEKDSRFYREVSDKLGYPVRSILCAPMVSGGRTFGCVELINKKESSVFTEAELGVLGYVAHQGARYLEQR